MVQTPRLWSGCWLIFISGMRKLPPKTELSHEILHIELNPSVRRYSAFMGLCVGYLCALPVQLVYSGVAVAIPSLPGGPVFLFGSYGVTSLIGICLGFASGSRYNRVSIDFNRDRIGLNRDGILSQEFLWKDVERVENPTGFRILTADGQCMRIPANTFQRRSYETVALRGKLREYIKPTQLNPKRWLVIGLCTFPVGVILFSVSPKPRDILAASDPSSGETWLRMLPSLFGAVSLFTGFIFLMLAAQVLFNKKRPHAYKVNAAALNKGSRVLRWEDVAAVHTMGAAGRLVEIRDKSGRVWRIDCHLYSNGDQLRDSILAYAPQEPTEPLRLANIETVRGDTVKGQIGPIGCFALLAMVCLVVSVGAFAFDWLPGRDNQSSGTGWVFLLCAIFFVAFLCLISYRISVTSEGVSQAWYIGVKRTLAFSEIQRVELRSSRRNQGLNEFMFLTGPSTTIKFGSGLWQYAEIRDAILASVPESIVRRT
jgi:hypothetical protein